MRCFARGCLNTVQNKTLRSVISKLSYSCPESNPVMPFLTRVSDVVRSGLRRHFQAGFQYHCRNDHLQTRRGWVGGVGEVSGHARLLADGDRRNQDRNLLQYMQHQSAVDYWALFLAIACTLFAKKLGDVCILPLCKSYSWYLVKHSNGK